jgi:4-azaleucine resistance transporter AzlC
LGAKAAAALADPGGGRTCRSIGGAPDWFSAGHYDALGGPERSIRAPDSSGQKLECDTSEPLTYASDVTNSQTSAAGPLARSARHSFAEGARDIWPVMVATIPFGMVYGALAAKQELSLTENLLMSALLFAGTSQFVALELWADPLPVWAIFFSVLAVNLRHVLYSAALGRRIQHWSPLARYAGLGLLTDPAVALTEVRSGSDLSAAYYFGLCLPLYVNWLVFTAVGAVFGVLIENPEGVGLDFVVTAYFLFLIVGFRKRLNAVAVAVASAAVSVLAYLMLGPPWHMAMGAVAGMAAAAALTRPGAKP